MQIAHSDDAGRVLYMATNIPKKGTAIAEVKQQVNNGHKSDDEPEDLTRGGHGSLKTCWVILSAILLDD